jgi:putative ABC transport system substrate-binding protein
LLSEGPHPFSKPLADALREFGWVEGKNLLFERRSADRESQLPSLAGELVWLTVDLILTNGTRAARAAKEATKAIPIVFNLGEDPVANGLVASLARPGGNVTGLSFLAASEIVGKQLELLKETVPQVSHMALLGNSANEAHQLWLGAAKVAAPSLGLRLQTLEARGPEEFEGAFAAMIRARAGAILVPTDGMFILHRNRIIDLAAKSRLPAMYGTSEFTASGGLMFYGPSLRDNFRRAASYVDKILKGAKPADLPVEQPTKFELVINLKTAKALGLTIPQSVLLRADEVIQ